MKLKKRQCLAWLLTLAMLISCLSVTAFATVKGDDWWIQYVGTPMEDFTIDNLEDGKVVSEGNYVLCTSDTHRYTYLVKDLLTLANSTIASDGETGNVGLICFGGDFANEKLIYADNMSILKAAIQTSPGTVAAYTKGNHEGNVSDEDFEALTGMSRIGETAVNKAGAYYFYNFGAFNGTQQFTTNDIAQLEAFLDELPEDNTKPVFIVSHYPLHYYNDRRSSKNADKVVELLNKHPETVFMWGHNHTEQDPNYGMIRVPGDIIQTGAKADTSKEIKFTYACLGALRDGVNGANGLLIRVNDDGTMNFRYLALNAAPDSEDTWTDAQGNENPIRYTSDEHVSSELTVPVPTEDGFKVIEKANVQVDRPLVDKLPATVVNEYSDRFDASDIAWTTGGAAVDGAFDFSTAYTVSFTLTAKDGYSFKSDAVVSVNKEYVGPITGEAVNAADTQISQDGKTAYVSYTFAPTVGQAEDAYSAATEIEEGGIYVMASSANNVAASYLYDPAQHGEESMPDYTAAAADVVIRDGKLVSEIVPSTIFTAASDLYGYLLYSDVSRNTVEGAEALNFLNMSTRGGELGLEAAEAVTLPIYCNWQMEDGVPYLDVDGAKKFVTFDGKAFGYVDDPAESNVRLYKVGTDNSGILYNASAGTKAPAAGEAPESGLIWTDPEGNAVTTFDYDTCYTATVTLTPPEGWQYAEPVNARICGNAAEYTLNGDGSVTLTYTFAATAGKPGRESGLTAVEADSITSGKQYVIVSDGMAMTSEFVHELYAAAVPVTVSGDKITSGVVPSMVFTLEGNDTDGYALRSGDAYLAAKSVNGTPDTWGFTTTDALSRAITFTLTEEGKLEVVSTGASAGPGGPPPGPTVVQNLYFNEDHFNYSAYCVSQVKLYEMTMAFEDVQEGRWSAKSIEKVAAAGIMVGMDKDTFAPEENLTRAMAIATIYRVAGAPEVQGDCPFTDVSENDYFYSAVVWGYENNIVAGTSDTTFSPSDNVTRQDYAAFIGRYLKSIGMEASDEDLSFTDASSISSYAVDGVKLCTSNKIIMGYEDNTFRPHRLASREEAASMLSALMDVAP